jgi:hypothetical protein
MKKRNGLFAIAAILIKASTASATTLCSYLEQPCDDKGDHFSCTVLWSDEPAFCSATNESSNLSHEDIH